MGQITLPILITGTLCVLAVGVGIGPRLLAGRAVPPPRTPLGDILPSVSLPRLEGSTENLRRAIGVNSAIIFVVGPDDCASCSDLPLEFRIIHSEFPQLAIVVIGSGGSADGFRKYFSQAHVNGTVFIDSQRQLLHRLGVQTEPLTLLTDTTGRILFADARSTSQAAQYPAATLLHTLGPILVRR